jgi:hypothetical protein
MKSNNDSHTANIQDIGIGHSCDENILATSSGLPFGRDCMKGKMWMADDFDAPLEDMKEYME